MRVEWERFVTRASTLRFLKVFFNNILVRDGGSNSQCSVGLVCHRIQFWSHGSTFWREAKLESHLGGNSVGICGWSLKVAWILGWTAWRTYCLLFSLCFSCPAVFLFLFPRIEVISCFVAVSCNDTHDTVFASNVKANLNLQMTW